MSNKVLTTTIACVFMLVAGNVAAVSEAAKIGANAGAMGYCADRFGSGDDKTRYKLLKIKTAKAYGDLAGDDRAKALIMKKAGEDGDYLGDPLTRDRCDSLRKVLYIKYKD